MPGGAALRRLLAIDLAAAGPDQAEVLAIIFGEEVRVDRSDEARIVQLDREVVAAFLALLAPGGTDFGAADEDTVRGSVLACLFAFGDDAHILLLHAHGDDLALVAGARGGEVADIGHDEIPFALVRTCAHRSLDGQTRAAVRGGRIPSGTAAKAKDGSGSGYFVSRCKGHLGARRKMAAPAPLRPGAPQGRSLSAARKAMHEAAGGADDVMRKRQIRTPFGALTYNGLTSLKQ